MKKSRASSGFAMTENELATLQTYHKHMLEHHKKMLKHYTERRHALRKKIAEATSQKITADILEKLKSSE